MARVQLYSDSVIADKVAHLAGVKQAIRQETEDYADVARGYLEEHRYPHDDHDSYIETDQGQLDGYVSLVDPGGAAAAIEFGHEAPDGSWVQGIHAVTWAMLESGDYE